VTGSAPKRGDVRKDTFERKAFTTSRLAEFATEIELTKQIGHPASLWPLVAVKELVDNALDAAERVGVAPKITVAIDKDTIVVTDNGPGIPASTVRKLTNFDAKTSSNAAYVAPTRGQQGNALQSILPMGYVLDGQAGAVTIEANGKAHHIDFAIDPVRRTPAVAVRAETSAVRTGTCVTVRWPSSPRSPLAAAEAGFLRLANRYVWLNTHLTLTATWLGEERVTWTATDPAWSKWKPNNSTSPHWYSPERLRLLMASEIALAEDRRQPSPSVREFVQQFRGLSSTVKASEICMKLGVGERETLADYFRSRPDGLKLLAAMQALSAPVKPAALGVLGREHLESLLVASGCEASSLIIRRAEVEHEGLPYVIEVAFGFRHDEGMDLNEGFNFTPAIGASPFRLAERLAYAQIEPGDPVTVFAHVASPRLDFLDRGKSRVSLPHAVSEKLTDMVVAVTAKWTKQKKAEIREHNAYLRRRDAMVGRDRPTTIKEAAYGAMEAAYLHASANDTLPANPRQIMYAARPAILAATGKETLDSKYFTQTLLPDFMNDNPELTADWDIAWDDRGHFREPHTGRAIGLGTLAVQDYLDGIMDPAIGQVVVASPRVETKGPSGRYGAVLYIEKEGFLPILEAAQLAERYDLALASSRVADIEGLDQEPVSLQQDKGALARRLRINGATQAEIDFLLTGPDKVGRRVELNAMNSGQFVAFVERKLNEHGVAKVVPGSELLARTYTSLRRGALATRALEAELARLNTEPVDVPGDLADRVQAYLAGSPAETWDGAVKAIMDG
jgi:DNA topoisomerase VI subunit B